MFNDKVKGMFFGVAYGDALGATIEKLSYSDKEKLTGRVETYKIDWCKANESARIRKGRVRGHGIITDDTLMTMALMEVYNIEKRHIDSYDMAKEFINQIAYTDYFVPELQKQAPIMERLFYPDQYIYLRHALTNCEPREGGIGNMVNCGAAMYIAPTGAVNAGNPIAAYNEAIAFCQGHQNSYGLEAAGVLAAGVAKAFEPGVTIDEIIDTCIDVAKDGTKMAIKDLCTLANKLKDKKEDKDFIVSEFHKAILKYSPIVEEYNIKPEYLGIPKNNYTPNRLYSIEELPIALAYIVLNDGDFEGSIVDGINSGRDVDSIGGMIGAILGAKQGSNIISEEIMEDLANVNKNEFFKVVDKFANTVRDIIKADFKQQDDIKEKLSQIMDL